jgi:CHAT domain-containing protein
MSLWKVDDAVTQKLMVKFYQKLIAYEDTRRAFREARAEIKKEHPEPYYWAAFILAGE